MKKSSLRTRTVNLLENLGIKVNKEDIKKAIESGVLNPEHTKKYGYKTHCELCSFLGIKSKESDILEIEKKILLKILKEKGFNIKYSDNLRNVSATKEKIKFFFED